MATVRRLRRDCRHRSGWSNRMEHQEDDGRRVLSDIAWLRQLCRRLGSNVNVKLLCILFLAAFITLTCSYSLAQDSKRTGIIRGIVLDATEQPVEDASVKANFTGGFSGIVPSARTDKLGHFVIQRLAWGGWYVTASKEQDGYPDESNAFYSGFNSAPVTVDLDVGNPERFVTVHLGSKAGSISGTVADAETGKPIEPCARLQWKNMPSIYWSGYGLLKSR